MHDVVLVGYGPVGQTLAAHLGRSGLDVCVFERFPALYNRPRAIRMDHEAMRIWQDLGIVHDLEDDILPIEDYEWFGADGQPLLSFSIPRGPSGWAHSYVFYQPYLEAALDRLVRSQPTVTLRQGWTVTGITQLDGHVEVRSQRTSLFEGPDGTPGVTDETHTVFARYVVGVDGANSSARDATGIAFDDLGFSERWVSVDVRPYDMSALPVLETSRMYCDPARPHVNCPNGRTHRRWEWMLLDGEDASDFRQPEQIWQLLSQWVTPAQAELVRWAVYEFHCGVVETMRRGNVFLAGDAAHLMPPHMGEGLCTGLRDARNLAWKLEHVLKGKAPDTLLETYSAERLAHSLALVRLSEQMGKISCELDPVRAAARDAEIRARGDLGSWPFPALEDGLLHRPAGGPTPLSGQLSVQGRISQHGRTGRYDDIAGPGFSLISLHGDPDVLLSSEQLAFLDGLGAQRICLAGNGQASARDADGELTGWLQAAGVAAVIVRPDFYVFGSAPSPSDVGTLVDDLRTHMAVVSEARS